MAMKGGNPVLAVVAVLSVLFTVTGISVVAGEPGDGRVTICAADRKGEPLGRAEILLFGPAGPAIARARTGDDGCVRLRMAPDTMAAVVRADGFSPTVVDLEAGVFDERRTVVLERTVSLRVRVVSADNHQVLASWRFIAEPAGEEWSRNPWMEAAAMSGGDAGPPDEDGFVILEDLPTPPAGVMFLAAGHQPGFVELGNDSRPVVVELRTEGCVRVTLVDGETGDPVAGVNAVPQALLPEGRTGIPKLGELQREEERFLRFLGIEVSDEKGEMTLCPPNGRRTWFVFLSEGHAPESAFVDPGRGTSARIELRGKASYALVVLDREDGRPLPGFPVRVRSQGYLRRAVTGPDGRVIFDDVPARTNWTAEVLSPGGGDALWQTSGFLSPGDEGIGQAFLEAGLAVRISIGDEEAASFPVVLLDPVEGDVPRIIEQGRTDNDGVARFMARQLPERALLVVRSPSCLLAEPLPADIGKDADGKAREVSIEGTWIGLRVVAAADGSPVAGAVARCVGPGGGLAPSRVAASRDHGPLWFAKPGFQVLPGDRGVLGIANRQGRMDLFVPRACGGIAVEGPALFVDDVPFRTRTVEREEIEDGMEVRLEALPGIRLVTSFDGEAPATVAVELRRWEEPLIVVSSRRITPGSIRIPAEDEGPWLVVVRATGYAPAAEGPVEMTADWAELPVRLERGGFLEVRGLRTSGGTVPPYSLSGPAGLDWSPWVGMQVVSAEGEGRVLRIGPLPMGQRTFVADACDGSVRIRFPNDVARVSCD